MNEEACIIEQIKDVLADIEPDVALRVIDYFTITHRPVLKALRDAPPRMPDPTGVSAEKPGFLHTQKRIDAGEVLLEVERLRRAKKSG